MTEAFFIIFIVRPQSFLLLIEGSLGNYSCYGILTVASINDINYEINYNKTKDGA